LMFSRFFHGLPAPLSSPACASRSCDSSTGRWCRRSDKRVPSPMFILRSRRATPIGAVRLQGCVRRSNADSITSAELTTALSNCSFDTVIFSFRDVK
jgi:hypothetical protein